MRDAFAYCYDFPMPIQHIAYAADWLGMALCSAFVVPLEERRPYLGRWGRHKKPVAVIINVCADELGTLPRESKIDLDSGKGRAKLGYLGYLSPSRAGFLLADLCNECQDQIELYVAGVLRFSALRDRLRQAPHVHSLGYLPRLEALALMRDLDVISLLCDPAAPNNRMLAPNKFYESLCVGTPVLVERQMSISRIVQENGLGWVVDYGDSEQLKKAIQEIRNTDALEQVRKRCREFYLKHFHYETTIAQYRNFYELLLDNK